MYRILSEGCYRFHLQGRFALKRWEQIFNLTIETGLGAIETRGDMLEQIVGAPAGEEELLAWRRSAPMQDLQEVIT